MDFGVSGRSDEAPTLELLGTVRYKAERAGLDGGAELLKRADEFKECNDYAVDETALSPNN